MLLIKSTLPEAVFGRDITDALGNFSKMSSSSLKNAGSWSCGFTKSAFSILKNNEGRSFRMQKSQKRGASWKTE